MIDRLKQNIRKQIRDKKKEYSLDEKKEKSKGIFQKLSETDHFKKAKTILAYWSMDDEVSTHDFVLQISETKKIILPTVKGDTLELKEFKGLSDMITGKSFGILEPQGNTYNELSQIDLIIVPGIAFDQDLNRLGRGKGYYDKLLKETPAYKVGVCFDFQVIEEVPVDSHDVKMDMVISG